MSEYAPNGGVVDAAFSTAVADADPGDRIVFDRFDYELTQQTVIEKPLTIDQTSDSTLICSNGSTTTPTFSSRAATSNRRRPRPLRHTMASGPFHSRMGIISSRTTACSSSQIRTTSTSTRTFTSTSSRVLMRRTTKSR